jgi:23S rRNA (guanine745-N1)-methyltransferase
MAVAEVVDLLVCPHCGQGLVVAEHGRVVRCPNGHAFDVARQGYLNLAGRTGPSNADTAAMVAARDRFLSAGHFAPIAETLSELADSTNPGARLLEVGAGTGYYLTRLLDGLVTSRGVALDVSVAAARRAARAHPRLGSVVADAWQPLPMASGTVDVLLNVFAPRNATEFARVLSGSGRLLTVTPTADHLVEVRRSLGLLGIQPEKQHQLTATLGGAFDQGATETLRFTMELDDSGLYDLVAMGPNAFHTSDDELRSRVAAVSTPVSVSAAVALGVWTPHR